MAVLDLPEALTVALGYLDLRKDSLSWSLQENPQKFTLQLCWQKPSRRQISRHVGGQRQRHAPENSKHKPPSAKQRSKTRKEEYYSARKHLVEVQQKGANSVQQDTLPSAQVPAKALQNQKDLTGLSAAGAPNMYQLPNSAATACTQTTKVTLISQTVQTEAFLMAPSLPSLMSHPNRLTADLTETEAKFVLDKSINPEVATSPESQNNLDFDTSSDSSDISDSSYSESEPDQDGLPVGSEPNQSHIHVTLRPSEEVRRHVTEITSSETCPSQQPDMVFKWNIAPAMNANEVASAIQSTLDLESDIDLYMDTGQVHIPLGTRSFGSLNLQPMSDIVYHWIN
jgi:hypothetical protein